MWRALKVSSIIWLPLNIFRQREEERAACLTYLEVGWSSSDEALQVEVEMELWDVSALGRCLCFVSLTISFHVGRSRPRP